MRALASYQYCPGSIPGLGVICELSLLLVHSPGFPLSSKINISKFRFDLDYCQTLYHEPLAWEIAQALHFLLALNKLLYFKVVRQ